MAVIYFLTVLAFSFYGTCLGQSEFHDCLQMNSSCEDCVANKHCIFCLSNNACLPYPSVFQWPSSSTCPPDLSAARWSSCSVNFKAMLIALTTICGVVVLAIAIIAYCVAVRCLRQMRHGRSSNDDEDRDPAEDAYFRIQNEKVAIERRADQRRREMLERNEEVRQKYGMRVKSNATPSRTNSQYSYVHLQEQTA